MKRILIPLLIIMAVFLMLSGSTDRRSYCLKEYKDSIVFYFIPLFSNSSMSNEKIRLA